jgi:hypothetical protein
MTDIEKQYFGKLTKKRKSFADQLDDPDYQGVKRTVVDKYSDQAHFIYELLQNADDAEATKSKIILKENGIYFYHNGTIPFSISDPEIKETDTKKIGHINAITSIGNSKKEEKSNTIGKFGVGFKSVFQYTNTPHIYDTNFQFKIERFIVPKLLSNDIQRNKTETVFYLPFNKDGMEPSRAYIEILEKMKSLVYPTLFLSHLKEVEWIAGKENGTYLTETKKTEEYTDIECNLIELLNEVNAKDENEKLWFLERKIAGSEHKIAIGFFLDKNGILKPTDYSAFCFFPTKESTKLKFIIHAPFLLTDSRESIKAGEGWNIKLIEELSNLAADSLLFLKEKSLVGDNIINIIPYRISDFTEIGDKDNLSMRPFYDAIKEKFKNNTLLPTRNGFHLNKIHAYWADAEELVNLFSDIQLAQLVNDPNAKWVFTSIGRTKDSEITQYIDGGDDRSWVKKEPNLISENMTSEKMLKRITSEFTEKQSFEWLCQLYEYLYERKSYQSFVKTKAIFMDNNNKAVSAFDDKDQAIIFMPTPEQSEYNMLHKDFLKNESAIKFFEAFGITKPNLKDEIYNIIIPKYNTKNTMDTTVDFKKFFRYYKECPGSQQIEYLNMLKNINWFQYKIANKGFAFLGNADSIYLPSPEIKIYFSLNVQTRFLDIDFYQKLVKDSDYKELEEFMLKLGVSKYPRIIENYVSAWQVGFEYDAKYVYDKSIDGCEDLLNNINKDRSIALWSILSFMIQNTGNTNFLMGEHKAGARESFESGVLKKIKSKQWLLDKNGKFVSPNEITVEELSDDYSKIGRYIEALINILDFKSSVRDYLNENEKKWIDIGKKFEGCSEEDIQKVLDHIKQRKPNFPDRPVTDFDRKRDGISRIIANAEEKLYETRQRRIRVSSSASSGEKTYLEYHYTNENIMYCQICKKEMPFKKRNGDYYYESVEVLSKKYLHKENKEQYLALCPECSARYNEFIIHNDSMMAELKDHIINGPEINLDLGDISENNHEPFVTNIYFEKAHLIDLQEILKDDNGGHNG